MPFRCRGAGKTAMSTLQGSGPDEGHGWLLFVTDADFFVEAFAVKFSVDAVRPGRKFDKQLWTGCHRFQNRSAVGILQMCELSHR